jgi:hypothetical protein
LCNVCANFTANLLKTLQGLMEPKSRGVEINARRPRIRVPKELLNDVQRHTAFDPPRTRFPAEVMEVQIDTIQGLAAFAHEVPPLATVPAAVGALVRSLLSGRRDVVRLQDARLPHTAYVANPPANGVDEDVRLWGKFIPVRVVLGISRMACSLWVIGITGSSASGRSRRECEARVG